MKKTEMTEKFGNMREACERSLAAQIERGIVDEERDAAAIALLLKMAAVMDQPDYASSLARYISPAAFTRLCDKLGIAPGDIDVVYHRDSSKPEPPII